MSAPLVSICIPCYNAEPWIGAAIRCSLGQTYAPKEVIVVDDGSTDGSLEVIKSFSDRIRCERQRHSGASAARNRAAAVSRGEFFQFLDADDVMCREKVERQMAVAIAHPGCVIYGPWRLVRPSKNAQAAVEIAQAGPEPEDADLIEKSLRGWYCAAHSYLWPREAVLSLGGWDESLSAGQDPDLAMRALVAGYRFVFSEGSWVDYVLHDAPRLSTPRTAQALRSRIRGLRKIQRMLEAQGRLTETYRRAIAYRFDVLARVHWEHCRATAAWVEREARRVSGRPTEVGAWYYRACRRLLGVYCTERTAIAKRGAGTALRALPPRRRAAINVREAPAGVSGAGVEGSARAWPVR